MLEFMKSQKLKKFEFVLDLYIQNFKTFNFVTYHIEDYGVIYVVEDSFVVYIGIEEYFDKEMQISLYDNTFRQDITGVFNIVFEELTYNNLFKFNIAKFKRSIPSAYDFIHYKKFNNFTDSYISHIYESKRNYIKKEYPLVALESREQLWEGISYSFIIYELAHEGKIGHAIISTTTNKLHSIAIKGAVELELKGYSYAYSKYHCESPLKFEEYIGTHPLMGMQITSDMANILADKIHSIQLRKGWDKLKRSNGRAVYIEKDLKYFIISQNVIDIKKPHVVAFDLLQKATAGAYLAAEKVEYLSLTNRWKSEQLVYEYVKELYPENYIIYQHKPYFLRTKKGQMSYDIFISGKNIAIEYQGQQHFEPVEYFGGTASFLAQKERDQLKAQLSTENNIKLVTINYWETITPDLIENKISECNI